MAIRRPEVIDLKSDYSASPHLEDYDDNDEGIYVFDEQDEDESVDLLMELAVVRKQLRSTELAYRALVRPATQRIK